MKISLKSVVAVALSAAAALSAVTASADVALPTSGNGELVLFARDEVTGVVYARGIGQTLDNILTQAASGGAYSGPQNIDYAIPTVGPDANMTAFLADAAGHDVSWGIQTADSVGSNIAGTPRRLAFTTGADIVATSGIPSNATLITTVGSVNSFLSSLNGSLPDAAGSSIYGPGGDGGMWGNAGTAGAGARNLAGNINYGLIGGDALNFYLVTSSGTTATGGGGLVGRVFQALDLTLSADGTLNSVAAPAPVPLPAALWLLGSGLIGLTGISRRRRAAV